MHTFRQSDISLTNSEKRRNLSDLNYDIWTNDCIYRLKGSVVLFCACAAIGFCSDGTVFKVVLCEEQLFHRPCETCVNHNNGIWDLFGRSWRIIAAYFVFLWEHRREIWCPWEEGHEAAREESGFRLVVALLPKKSKPKKKKKRRKDGRQKIERYIYNSVPVSIKTIHAHYRDTGPLTIEETAKKAMQFY